MQSLFSSRDAGRQGIGKGASKASRMLRQRAEDVHLKRAKQIVAVTDGAVWITTLALDNLPKETTAILDWYHASQHAHTARRAMFGESDPDGAAWADGLLKTMTSGSFDTLWQTLLDARYGRVDRARTLILCSGVTLDGWVYYEIADVDGC